ncbi:MAG: hypothetical protein ABJE10_23755, partial [bacterium]
MFAQTTDITHVAGATELVEAEAWAQMHAALPDDVRVRMGCSLHRFDGAAALMTSRSRELAVNRVIAFGVRSPATRAVLDAITEMYHDAEVERFIVHVSPGTNPGDITGWLLERRFTLRPGLVKLARSTDDASSLPASPELRIEEIGVADGDIFEEIVGNPLNVPSDMRAGIRSTIGHPGWRYYLAYRDATPIAGSAMYVGENAAWCGLTATIEGARGQGAQSALLRRRLMDAADM